MGKSVFIAEKPSVAQEFAKALHVSLSRRDGYLEGGDVIVTWCVGHLVTMSYPEAYDPNLKRWSLDTIPFIPQEYKYEVLPAVKKQFDIVSSLLNREDVETIYVCTDSGREGEYIYRLVRQEAKVTGKKEKRVWIDSQTEEEIQKGIKNAKDISEYNNLSDAAYLRAKEDYLMGINFSRVLTLKYGRNVANYLHEDRASIAVGRVMTCVLGMVVKREREIRAFVKTPFYRVIGSANLEGHKFDAEWKVSEKSKYYNTPYLYNDKGFKDKEKATELLNFLSDPLPQTAVVESIERKKETKNPPLLYNLAEIQNECSKLFKISPDQTLNIIQELYEKKLVTYPRTDARVLSTAISKEINKNIAGLRNFAPVKEFASEILEKESFKGIEKTRYCNDKAITDHYAIIPTGQGFNNLGSLSQTALKTYEVICRRFLSIFYPAAIYQRVAMNLNVKDENLYASFKTLADEGYLKVAKNSFSKASKASKSEEDEADEDINDTAFFELLKKIRKGANIDFTEFNIKEGETSPPKRYSSGSMILAMENAGQLIEDEELRAQIKGSGIGTSATRAEILKKLETKKYISIAKKTQIITPSLFGEIIYDVVANSIKALLNPELTASWEKGLTMVANGDITADEYMEKMNAFVVRRTNGVKMLNNQGMLYGLFNESAKNYKK
ncbi:DNA topoisomerase [Lachnospira multipara]|uniref:DNA topoisomerase n=1 Tax=Lachnospira multipara TaxID=28051 RepID=UPI000429F37A|nr:DNA topoisomerase [Lachnospira multipara]